jgi:hypothetical protein
VRSLKPGYGGGVYGTTADSQGAMFDASGESDLVDALQREIKVEAATPAIMALSHPRYLKIQLMQAG